MQCKSLLLVLLCVGLTTSALIFAVSPLFHASARGNNNVVHSGASNNVYTVKYFDEAGNLVKI